MNVNVNVNVNVRPPAHCRCDWRDVESRRRVVGYPHELTVVGCRKRIPLTDLFQARPLNLFIVDDDEDVRTALRRMLRSMGHTVSVFASAEEYEAAPAGADCLILDLRLPRVNGLELRERIRKRGSQLPIVFITGDAGLSTGGPEAPLGAPALAKPFDDGELIAAITRAMSANHESAV